MNENKYDTEAHIEIVTDLRNINYKVIQLGIKQCYFIIIQC